MYICICIDTQKCICTHTTYIILFEFLHMTLFDNINMDKHGQWAVVEGNLSDIVNVLMTSKM